MPTLTCKMVALPKLKFSVLAGEVGGDIESEAELASAASSPGTRLVYVTASRMIILVTKITVRQLVACLSVKTDGDLG